MSLVGQPHPAFANLYGTDRKPFDGSSLAGKKAVVAFYPAAFTGVCTKEMCTFRDSLASFNTIGAEVVAISVDSPFSNGEFATKNGLTFPVLSDYTRATVNAWGVAMEGLGGLPGYVSSKRAVFVLDGNGVVIWEWTGPNPGVEPDYEAIKAALG